MLSAFLKNKQKPYLYLSIQLLTWHKTLSWTNFTWLQWSCCFWTWLTTTHSPCLTWAITAHKLPQSLIMALFGFLIMPCSLSPMLVLSCMAIICLLFFLFAVVSPMSKVTHKEHRWCVTIHLLQYLWSSY